MMTVFLTIAIISVLVILLSIGVIFANKEMRGSCGGSCECTPMERKSCDPDEAQTIQAH